MAELDDTHDRSLTCRLVSHGWAEELPDFGGPLALYDAGKEVEGLGGSRVQRAELQAGTRGSAALRHM